MCCDLLCCVIIVLCCTCQYNLTVCFASGLVFYIWSTVCAVNSPTYINPDYNKGTITDSQSFSQHNLPSSTLSASWHKKLLLLLNFLQRCCQCKCMACSASSSLFIPLACLHPAMLQRDCLQPGLQCKYWDYSQIHRPRSLFSFPLFVLWIQKRMACGTQTNDAWDWKLKTGTKFIYFVTHSSWATNKCPITMQQFRVPLLTQWSRHLIRIMKVELLLTIKRPFY